MGSDDGFSDPVNGGGSLFSDQVTHTSDYLDFNPIGIWSDAIDAAQAGWSTVIDFLTGDEDEVAGTTPPEPELPEDPETCDRMLEAQQNMALELKRFNKNFGLFCKLHIGTQSEVQASLNMICVLLMEKFPHRKFQMSSAIDLQHHIRDGMDALAIRMAQVQEAANGVKVAEIDLPELKHTDPKKDEPIKGKSKRFMWRDDAVKPEEGG